MGYEKNGRWSFDGAPRQTANLRGIGLVLALMVATAVVAYTAGANASRAEVPRISESLNTSEQSPATQQESVIRSMPNQSSETSNMERNVADMRRQLSELESQSASTNSENERLALEASINSYNQAQNDRWDQQIARDNASINSYNQAQSDPYSQPGLGSSGYRLR